MVLSEYYQLKQQVILGMSKSDEHSEILISLKNIFKDNINSIRRIEQINSVGQLLQVLEYRDVLSEDNVALLKDVVKKLPKGVELIRKISDYEQFLMATETLNFNDFRNNLRQEISSYSSMISHPITENMSSVKKQKFYETITEELGTNWRNVARFLEISECAIIEIDNQNISLSNKVMKILEIHKHTNDYPQWFTILCNALEKSQRKDIADSLRDIMGSNI